MVKPHDPLCDKMASIRSQILKRVGGHQRRWLVEFGHLMHTTNKASHKGQSPAILTKEAQQFSCHTKLDMM